MSYILITNSDGVSLSLVHEDNEGTYLAHHARSLAEKVDKRKDKK